MNNPTTEQVAQSLGVSEEELLTKMQQMGWIDSNGNITPEAQDAGYAVELPEPEDDEGGLDQIQADATIFAYELAVASNDPDAYTQVTVNTMARVRDGAFGFVAAAALRMMTVNISNPVLEVTDRMHRTGLLSHDLRARLIDARDNAVRARWGTSEPR